MNDSPPGLDQICHSRESLSSRGRSGCDNYETSFGMKNPLEYQRRLEAGEISEFELQGLTQNITIERTKQHFRHPR